MIWGVQKSLLHPQYLPCGQCLHLISSDLFLCVKHCRCSQETDKEKWERKIKTQGINGHSIDKLVDNELKDNSLIYWVQATWEVWNENRVEEYRRKRFHRAREEELSHILWQLLFADCNSDMTRETVSLHTWFCWHSALP